VFVLSFVGRCLAKGLFLVQGLLLIMTEGFEIDLGSFFTLAKPDRHLFVTSSRYIPF